MGSPCRTQRARDLGALVLSREAQLNSQVWVTMEEGTPCMLMRVLHSREWGQGSSKGASSSQAPEPFLWTWWTGLGRQARGQYHRL